MNLAVIRRECTFGKGGAERYAANLCRALARMGHKVWVVAERCDPDLAPGVVHVPVAVNRATSASGTRSFHRNSQRALASLRADAVFALSRTFPSDAFRVSDPIHAAWMKLRYSNPFRRWFETCNPRHRAILGLERAIFEAANTRMIVTNSELSKRMILERFAFPAERIHVVYNGVDQERFTAGPLPEATGKPKELRLLFVGQDFKRKGLGPLLRALAIVRKKGLPFRLRVVGRDRPAPYQKLAARLGLERRVEFSGTTSAIDEVYRSADLLVFPTLYDPFANVCLEALACGLPVLTTTTNGAAEVVEPDRTGYVVNGELSGLPGRLADALLRHGRKSLESRNEMREAAVAQARGFTIEANARRVLEILQQAAEQRKASE